MPRLVIFDCDGVLIDSESIACQIEAQAFIDIGCQLDLEEAITSFTGRPDSEIYAEIKERFGITVPAGHDARVTQMLEAGFRAELKATEGIQQALARIDLPCALLQAAASAGLSSLWGLLACSINSPRIFSVRKWSSLASRRRMSSCMPRSRWMFYPPVVWLSKIALQALRPLVPPACAFGDLLVVATAGSAMLNG